MGDTKPSVYGRCRIVQNWPDWDLSLHSDGPQIERQGRAFTYPFTFTINKNSQTARFSSTSELPYYETSLSTCTCMDFQERKLPCKHIYRLAAECGVIEIIKRPVYDKDKLEEIKNSSDIDNTPDQLKRQQSGMSSKCAPKEIDYENKTATFSGSGKSPYITTQDTCTCRDYFVRKLPCKHIYRLRHELNKHEN